VGCVIDSPLNLVVENLFSAAFNAFYDQPFFILDKKSSIVATRLHAFLIYICNVSRYISFLLASYILVVVCMPCNDDEVCIDEAKNPIASVVEEHEHSPSEVDLCSPFCICNCCHSTISQPKYFSFGFHPMENTDFNATIKPHSIQSISYSIWQPPKLA
jgi:hypothetical protein